MSAIPYFIFNGVDSRDMGVVVRSLPPISRPTERVTEVTVPGRHGRLIMTEGDSPVYDSYSRTVDCYIRPDVNPELVLTWLRGSGKAIFSNEPDRAYRSRIYQGISLEKIMRGHGHKSFSVSFLVEPEKEQAFPPPAISFTGASGHGALFNPGNIPAKPIISATISGSFSLIVGATAHTAGGITTYTDDDGTHTFSMADPSQKGILIDSGAEMVTTADGETNLTMFSSGSFPAINPGTALIAWSGDISSFSIQPEWRWV